MSRQEAGGFDLPVKSLKNRLVTRVMVVMVTLSFILTRSELTGSTAVVGTMIYVSNTVQIRSVNFDVRLTKHFGGAVSLSYPDDSVKLMQSPGTSASVQYNTSGGELGFL